MNNFDLNKLLQMLDSGLSITQILSENFFPMKRKLIRLLIAMIDRKRVFTSRINIESKPLVIGSVNELMRTIASIRVDIKFNGKDGRALSNMNRSCKKFLDDITPLDFNMNRVHHENQEDKLVQAFNEFRDNIKLEYDYLKEKYC